MLQWLARLLAPPNCIGCASEGTLLCAACLRLVPSPPHPSCFSCNKHNRLGTTCLPCRRVVAVRGYTAATTYDGLVRVLIRCLKYQRQREAAAVLASLMAPLVEASNYDCITAVPVATNRLRHRGYNQAELIARQLSRELQLPYRPLVRRTRNIQQVGKTSSQRLRQAEVAFAPGRIGASQRVLLVDDVMTTGATLNACAKVLGRSQALTWVLVAAHKER